jgi:hypothetical protein
LVDNFSCKVADLLCNYSSLSDNNNETASDGGIDSNLRKATTNTLVIAFELWMLVDAKQGERKLSENLIRFAGMLKVRHAFQVVKDLPYENVDIFKCERPVIAPARTFLSQLL